MTITRLSAAPGQMLRASRLLCAAVTLLAGVAQAAGAQSHPAHLSDDLKHHIDSGDATASTVIVSGTAAQVNAIAARHGLRVLRRLTSGAVLDVPAGHLSELADDADVPQLSGDHVIRG